MILQPSIGGNGGVTIVKGQFTAVAGRTQDVQVQNSTNVFLIVCKIHDEPETVESASLIGSVCYVSDDYKGSLYGSAQSYVTTSKQKTTAGTYSFTIGSAGTANAIFTDNPRTIRFGTASSGVYFVEGATYDYELYTKN